MGQAVLTVWEDTRQQKGKHKNIEDYCRRNGIRLVRQMLNVGDYMLAGSSIPVIDGKPYVVSCDTKMSVAEIAGNCFQGHDVFRDECQRANDFGIKLIVLIEEMPPDGDIAKWRTPMDRYGRPKYKFDPAILKKTMETMTKRYGVQFRFCDGRSTGRLLIEYLKGERQ